MAKDAVLQRVFRQVTVNLKSATATSVVDAISGKRLLVTGAWLEPTDRTGSGSNAQISLGSNASDYDNLMVTKAIVTEANKSTQLILGTASPNGRWTIVDISSTGLHINVDVASTHTTDTVTVWIEGVLLP